MIRAGWNELLIAAFSFKSTHLNEDAIRLSDGTVIAKDEAHLAGKCIFKTALFSSMVVFQPLSDVKLSHSILFNIFTGVGEIFDRVVIEVIQKMKEMKMVSCANIRAYLNIEQSFRLFRRQEI